MKRRRHIILNALTLFSLLLCVGMVVLWARSYWYTYMEITCISPTTDVTVAAGTSGFYVHIDVLKRPNHESWSFHFYSYLTREGEYGSARMWWKPTIFNRLGFSGAGGPPEAMQPPRRIYVWVIVPFWALTLAAGLLPTLWLRRRILYRSRTGHCTVCSYDLRATPDRCPECGAVPTQAN
jgi:hypothetical protein